MRIHLVETVIFLVPRRFFCFGNMCHRSMSHIMALFVNVISGLTPTAFKKRYVGQLVT